jgi:Uncharacterized conserved protein
MIKIITVGKKNLSWIEEGVKEFQKRLAKPFILEWVQIQNSAQNGKEAVKNESEAILKAIDTLDYVILLDETGKNIDSLMLSQLITTQIELSRQIVIIIGGAFGVDESIKMRANFTWSLSRLVFPHQLVRLILTEQIYRAQEIHLNHPYHHR